MTRGVAKSRHSKVAALKVQSLRGLDSNEGFYLALGVTVCIAVRSMDAPTMPRHVAYAGVAGGILIMFAEFLDPAMKPPFSVVILF